MEDILKVYERPYNPAKPVVCLDETSKEIRGDVREPIPAQPPALQEGQSAKPAREDYEYERDGTCSLFMAYEPITGKSRASVSNTRTGLDYAHVLKSVCDDMYPDAEKIVLVQDNLNTHSIGSLYRAFEPEEASRLVDRLEIHYTPTHGSWLNMAEIAIRLLCDQCLSGQRFPSIETLRREVAAWQELNDRDPMKTDWRFTTADARIKLKRLYPKISPS
jgi:hypothetical protein